MGFGMLLGWLFPVGLLILLVFGAVIWFRRGDILPVDGSSAPATQPGVETYCQHCGEALESGGDTCLYCGEAL